MTNKAVANGLFMDAKIGSLIDIFKDEISSDTLVSLWNTYCKENDLWVSIIYKNTPKVINEEFPDAASFARLFAYGSVYDYTSDWLVYGDEDIHSFDDLSEVVLMKKNQ